MKAKINEIEVEGTPEEMRELLFKKTEVKMTVHCTGSVHRKKRKPYKKGKAKKLGRSFNVWDEKTKKKVIKMRKKGMMPKEISKALKGTKTPKQIYDLLNNHKNK